MRSNLFAGLSLLGLLAACDSKPPPPAAAPPRPAQQAPAPAASPVTSSDKPSASSIPAGRYEALSTTASAFTGDIELDGRSIKGQSGLIYDAAPASTAKGGDLADGEQTFASILIVAKDTPVEIRKVSAETAPPKSVNGGLCGKDAPPTYLAVALDHDPSGPMLKLAAFQGPDAPGGAGKAVQLCGTFNYVVPAHP